MGSTKKKLALRCFAYPGVIEGQKGFYAVCIDLNLITWRPTLKEAKRSLDDAVVGYMDTVVDVIKDEEFSSANKVVKRILRRAPFFPYQLQYYYYKLFGWMHLKTPSTYKESVSVPLPNPV
jgi:hypothetical protein